MISIFIHDKNRKILYTVPYFPTSESERITITCFILSIRERRIKSATRREAECKRDSLGDWRDKEWGLRCIVRRPVEHLNGFSSSFQDRTRES